MARRPFDGPVIITTEYGTPQPGTRRGYQTGVDYALSQGTPVLAPESGVIVRNGDGTSSSDGRGYYTVLKGDSGTYHQLFHFMKMATASGRVNEGAVIGYVGSTGFSSGPHLHWETTRADDRNSDFPPAEWLFARQPVYTPPVTQVKQFVRIFGDYRSVWAAPGSATKNGTVRPAQFGGKLDYEILERSGNYVRIQTQMYGQGWILANGPLVDSLTQFYNK